MTNWSLFLDRDGVINERIPGAYISDWESFHFRPHTLEALQVCSSLFHPILVVTNQQGIGKGLMTTDQLQRVHNQMIQEVQRANGRIDKVYFCPSLAGSEGDCRKPNTHMGIQAQEDFPEINFSRSFMVGDSISDLKFGRNLGMKTVLIESKMEARIKIEAQSDLKELIDYSFPDLLGFVDLIRSSSLLNQKL